MSLLSNVLRLSKLTDTSFAYHAPKLWNMISPNIFTNHFILFFHQPNWLHFSSCFILVLFSTQRVSYPQILSSSDYLHKTSIRCIFSDDFIGTSNHPHSFHVTIAVIVCSILHHPSSSQLCLGQLLLLYNMGINPSL